MKDGLQAGIRYTNRIEPHNLIDTFLKYPPQGFEARNSEQGIPLFFAPFDLLTTADDTLRNSLSHWPGYRWWHRIFTIDTCFVGTTVSEYSPLLAGQQPAEMARQLLSCAPHKKLIIVKDLPHNSPLIPASDNLYAQAIYDACLRQGFIGVEGQALAYVPINFDSTDDYLARLSRSRRKNLRRKLRSREEMLIESLPTGDERFDDPLWRAELYQLYLAVYNQSEIHFDLLTPEFFDRLLTDPDSNGRMFLYWYDGTLVGYNLCYQQNGLLIDKYIGLNYPLALDLNLYFVSWFVNLEYALENGLRFYVAGWTDPQVKASLGASFTLTRHLVWVRNPLLRRVLRRLRHYFESDAQWHRAQNL